MVSCWHGLAYVNLDDSLVFLGLPAALAIPPSQALVTPIGPPRSLRRSGTAFRIFYPLPIGRFGTRLASDRIYQGILVRTSRLKLLSSA